jgi:SAM-dependent methyltransferase
MIKKSSKIFLFVLFFISLSLEASNLRPTRKPDIHFVPTPHEVVEVMLNLADVKEGDIVYDLGCGDGRIVIAAAKKGARSFGYDIDPVMVRKSKNKVKKAKLNKDQVTIEEKDIFKLDLSKASVVTLYLLYSLNTKLIPQLEKLKPGSRIVSHDFGIEGVQADVEATVFLKDGTSSNVYLFTTPLRKIVLNELEI